MQKAVLLNACKIERQKNLRSLSLILFVAWIVFTSLIFRAGRLARCLASSYPGCYRYKIKSKILLWYLGRNFQVCGQAAFESFLSTI